MRPKGEFGVRACDHGKRQRRQREVTQYESDGPSSRFVFPRHLLVCNAMVCHALSLIGQSSSIHGKYLHLRIVVHVRVIFCFSCQDQRCCRNQGPVHTSRLTMDRSRCMCHVCSILLPEVGSRCSKWHTCVPFSPLDKDNGMVTGQSEDQRRIEKANPGFNSPLRRLL